MSFLCLAGQDVPDDQPHIHRFRRIRLDGREATERLALLCPRLVEGTSHDGTKAFNYYDTLCLLLERTHMRAECKSVPLIEEVPGAAAS